MAGKIEIGSVYINPINILTFYQIGASDNKLKHSSINVSNTPFLVVREKNITIKDLAQAKLSPSIAVKTASMKTWSKLTDQLIDKVRKGGTIEGFVCVETKNDKKFWISLYDLKNMTFLKKGSENNKPTSGKITPDKNIQKEEQKKQKIIEELNNIYKTNKALFSIFANIYYEGEAENYSVPELFKDLKNTVHYNFDYTVVRPLSQAIKEYKKLKEYIKKKKIKPGPFGNLLFAPNRKSDKKVPQEPNTPEEEKFLYVLAKHFDDNIPIPPDKAKLLKAFLTSNLYKDIIHEPVVEKVYRGIGVSTETLKKFLKKQKVPMTGKIKVNMLYKPHTTSKLASSWSENPKKAWDFATRAEEETGDHLLVRVIFTAKISDNPDVFVAGPDGLYNVGELAQYPEEKEAVGLGTIKISEIEWFSTYPIK